MRTGPGQSGGCQMKIYHYTDLNGLKGIIESGSLW
ncbi:hypothetical protein OFO87_30285, partial [Escherichia coli]|nr:hypothetical protein [Escherichia coli]